MKITITRGDIKILVTGFIKIIVSNPTFLNIRLKQAKNRIISPFFRFPKKLTR